MLSLKSRSAHSGCDTTPAPFHISRFVLKRNTIPCRRTVITPRQNCCCPLGDRISTPIATAIVACWRPILIPVAVALHCLLGVLPIAFSSLSPCLLSTPPLLLAPLDASPIAVAPRRRVATPRRVITALAMSSPPSPYCHPPAIPAPPPCFHRHGVVASPSCCCHFIAPPWFCAHRVPSCVIWNATPHRRDVAHP